MLLAFFDVKLAIENLPMILSGLPMTIYVSLISMGIGMVLGLFISLARQSANKLLQIPARISSHLCVGHQCSSFILNLLWPTSAGIEFTIPISANRFWFK